MLNVRVFVLFFNTAQFNRPKTLNAFGGKLMVEVVAAIRELNDHPHTVFTVLTGEGRFFSSGADVKGEIIDRLRFFVLRSCSFWT
jgi:enoyl-CoA hydratase/carnithine racemase